ncbi:MAG: GNAT family N-acetyltransferase, partial [Solirubrobacteraceae bacterium]
LAGELDHADATAQASKGMSRHYPIPVAILARLAVDRRRQREGIGAALLHDAVQRVVVASEQLGVRAVVVHAIDDRAARFYERFGFRGLSATPRTLMVTLAELRAAGYT